MQPLFTQAKGHWQTAASQRARCDQAASTVLPPFGLTMGEPYTVSRSVQSALLVASKADIVGLLRHALVVVICSPEQQLFV